MPAIDGVNGKAEVLGGSLAGNALYGIRGARPIPVANQFGIQRDGVVRSYDLRGFGAAVVHGFWRDPSRGPIGLFASHTPT